MKTWQIILIVVGILLLLSVLIFIIIKNKKKGKVKIDTEFINSLLNYLGGKENIKGYSIDNARVKFELNDISKASLDDLHALSPKGVFVTNNNVKTLFKYESKEIIQMLNKTLK